MGPPWSPFTIITHDLMCMIALEKAKFITNLFEAVRNVLCLNRFKWTLIFLFIFFFLLCIAFYKYLPGIQTNHQKIPRKRSQTQQKNVTTGQKADRSWGKSKGKDFFWYNFYIRWVVLSQKVQSLVGNIFRRHLDTCLHKPVV